jgi:hypothetical protein
MAHDEMAFLSISKTKFLRVYKFCDLENVDKALNDIAARNREKSTVNKETETIEDQSHIEISNKCDKEVETQNEISTTVPSSTIVLSLEYHSKQDLGDILNRLAIQSNFEVAKSKELLITSKYQNTDCKKSNCNSEIRDSARPVTNRDDIEDVRVHLKSADITNTSNPTSIRKSLYKEISDDEELRQIIQLNEMKEWRLKMKANNYRSNINN